ncbi:MAG: LPD7 domain-containing protein [Alphaproteobacteria bacterium]
MANDGAQTGGNEERKDVVGSDIVKEPEALTGVSNGSAPEIVITTPAPDAAAAAKTTPPAAEGAAAIVAPPAEEEAPPVIKAPPPPQQQQQPAPKTDEYDRDGAPKAPALPAEPDAEEEIRDTRKMRQLLNDKWGLQWPDPVLHNIMQKGSVTKGFGGIVFELEGGSTIKWHENFMQQGEFVGKTGFFAKVSEEEAEATVAIAKNRGWTKLNVYGNRDQKEMFWLEAKKQGMEVANFQPMADSPIMQKWAQHQQGLADKTLAGVQSADNAPLDVKGEVKPGADERPGAARRAAEAEAAATEEGAPAKPTPAAKEEAPKTIAASSIAGKAAKAAAGGDAMATADAILANVATPGEATPNTPKTPEEIKDFFQTKINESAHPKMKEALARMSDRLSQEGVDEKVVKQVCDKLNEDGRVTLKTHNAAVAIINENIPSDKPLIGLGPRQQQPQRGGPSMKV